jgi:RP/EB family microtubule-associated protein
LQSETLEKERDFYFGKLRDIEILLQARGGESNDNPAVQDILKILYASEEEKVQVSSDGSLVITSTAVKGDEEMAE